MRRVFGSVLALVTLAYMPANDAWAQGGGYCDTHGISLSQVPPNYSCTSAGALPSPIPIGTLCRNDWGNILSGLCFPIKGHKHHRPRCNTCPNDTQAFGGLPIDFASGNTFVTQNDISLPGLGGGLTLTRTWNSVPSSVYASGTHMFGMNWQSTYEDRLVFETPERLLIEEGGDEDETAFGLETMGTNVNTYSVDSPAKKVGTMSQNAANGIATNWTLVSKSGEKRVYDPTTGFLLSIADRNGNTTQLTYDSSNRLITVTDPASRHLNFNYQSPSSRLVSSVTTDVGITLSYSYDSVGRLIKVTKPDATNVTFTYDGNNRITAVLDNEGKVLESHTYDSVGRGLTSSQANGVNSLTVTYP